MQSRTIAAVLMSLSAVAWAQEPGLERAQGEASQAVQDTRDRLQRYRDFERLKKDLRYIAEEVDREALGDRKSLDNYSANLVIRVAGLRAHGNIHAKLVPSLDRLDRIAKDLPSRTYAEQFPRGLIRNIAEQLRWTAENAQDEAELLRMLDEDLDVPGDMEAEALFPVDLPLAKFKKLGPIRIFLVKHRIKRPKTHMVTTEPHIVAGALNVQVGVELEGDVVADHRAVDLDYTFDIGKLHLEITPEWRLLHPNMPLPKKGDRVRVKGWTYYDIFHKAEEEYDPEHPTLGVNRFTQWEVHPVQEVVIVRSAEGIATPAEPLQATTPVPAQAAPSPAPTPVPAPTAVPAQAVPSPAPTPVPAPAAPAPVPPAPPATVTPNNAPPVRAPGIAMPGFD